ncbi:glycerol-3-phosphate 1-O-acyltransferase PlsY [Paludisphaera mucosa]|uniref:Glycerol-3-phosphate acyltransferase n=1 Tax=Paludisphaera mucosa TaxID=3030827 RepID=A0ABT6F8X0_9BACT|nr:glycerol-3-phosphate 1-O-acyltransferase PlsY [Paludisphaera mucosa]MDG3004036.1 glycerol-3-phosphate 1-O-acyltransferase PlsY [Paludisphaera mucosa]
MSWTYVATALAAYLIGSIPFGYLIYYALTKEDVRKVGSGNIGATNVGRLLGFRFFVLVFALDVLKGLLPTLLLPMMFARLGWDVPTDLPVAAALGAILGHNFPVFLGFHGGKGVATSLGALLALLPGCCGVAAVAFFAVFAVSRYVSLSSIAGGLAFGASYFWWTSDPWAPSHRALSALVAAVVVLLIARHRKNVGRLLAGTENRVNFRRPKADGASPPAQPSGMIRPGVLAGLAVAAAVLFGAGALILRRAQTPVEAIAGPWLLHETHREATGQQRSTRVAFDAAGDRLAVLCPRYNRILTYRIDDDAKLSPLAKIAVDGRPVAIAVVGGNVAVLQRPVNDAKHLGPGWLDVFALDGGRVGSRVEAGYYPDDLAATPDGAFLIVLASGRGEGDVTKHAPELSVFATSAVLGSTPTTAVGRLAFEDGDDLDRLTLSQRGSHALATLVRQKTAVAIDLTDPSTPRLAGRMDLQRVDEPYVSASDDGDWILVPAQDERDAVAVTSSPVQAQHQESAGKAGYLVVARPDDSSLEMVQIAPPIVLGRFPVLGPLNVGGAEPSGLAYCARRRLLAAATKPGTVHLIRLESRVDAIAAAPPASRFAAR